jgi:hypothetical protein
MVFMVFVSKKSDIIGSQFAIEEAGHRYHPTTIAGQEGRAFLLLVVQIPINFLDGMNITCSRVTCRDGKVPCIRTAFDVYVLYIGIQKRCG